jgi:hypothetical protein
MGMEAVIAFGHAAPGWGSEWTPDKARANFSMYHMGQFVRVHVSLDDWAVEANDFVRRVIRLGYGHCARCVWQSMARLSVVQ